MNLHVDEKLAGCEGFDWDEGNLRKNWEKHRVTVAECEQAFFNMPLIAFREDAHSEQEERFFVLGQADSGRLLFLVFTIRGRLIRVISARTMSRKERRSYEHHGKETQKNSKP